MLSKGAKRWILDDITWFPKYFWQMTIAWSEEINYEMNFTLCVLLVYNDNGSVQTLCITRVKFILYIYIIFMYLDFVLSIVIMEMAVFLLKIRRYAQ